MNHVTRPVKNRSIPYDDAIAQAILKLLGHGKTRTAAARECGITAYVLNRWIANDSDFLEDIQEAEAIAENRLVSSMAKAAAGYDVKTVKTTTRTVVHHKVTTMKDGTRISEPVPVEMVITEETVSREFDWRAAEAILRRRNPNEWGDGIRWEKLTEEQLYGIVEQLQQQSRANTARPIAGEVITIEA